MRIDSNAATGLTHYTGDPAETDFLRYDISNLAHNALDDAAVLVIGVGGGRDVLSALEFGQRSVTGVEINPNILKITNGVYGDYTGHLDRDPRVTFVADEARSYLTRSKNRYDLIQMSLIDTWAASSAGAYALSENSLYTTQAWDTFLDRLTPNGLLSGVALVLDSRTGAATRGLPRGRARRRGAPRPRRRRSARAHTGVLRPTERAGGDCRDAARESAAVHGRGTRTADGGCRAAPLPAGAHARRGRRRALRRSRLPRPGRGRRGRRRRRHLAAHRRPAVLLPDGRPRDDRERSGLLT